MKKRVRGRGGRGHHSQQGDREIDTRPDSEEREGCIEKGRENTINAKRGEEIPGQK